MLADEFIFFHVDLASFGGYESWMSMPISFKKELAERLETIYIKISKAGKK